MSPELADQGPDTHYPQSRASGWELSPGILVCPLHLILWPPWPVLSVQSLSLQGKQSICAAWRVWTNDSHVHRIPLPLGPSREAQGWNCLRESDAWGQWCGGRFIKAGSSCLRDASADHTGLLSYPRSGGLTLESCTELQPSDGSIRTFYPCSWHGLEHKHKSECLSEILMPTVPNGPSSTDWGLVE